MSTLIHLTNDSKYMKELNLIFEQKIIDCVENGRNLEISNGHLDHAAQLFLTFFKYGKEEIDIYSGELFDGIFNDKEEVVSQAKKFLIDNKDAYIKIAFQHNVSLDLIMNKKLVKELINDPTIQNRIKIYNASKLDKTNHFAVMDRCAYRLELNHETRTAVANFGDERKALEYYNQFQEIIMAAELCYPS